MKFHKLRLSENQVTEAIDRLSRYRDQSKQWKNQQKLTKFLNNFLKSLEKQTRENPAEEESSEEQKSG